jgi:hypothetical protein
MKNRKYFIKTIALSLTLLLVFGSIARVSAQTERAAETYGKIEMLSPDGKKIREIAVRVRLLEDSLEIESTATGAVLKTMNYKEIQGAEYSYTKNPRWKTGLGLGAASILFFPLLLIAIPIGFSKHRRHWLTVRTDKDFAVLKLSKSMRKLFIPAFETRSSVKVTALGDDK